MDADSALMVVQLVVFMAAVAVLVGFVLIVIVAVVMVLLVAIAFGGAAQRADVGTFLAMAPPFPGGL